MIKHRHLLLLIVVPFLVYFSSFFNVFLWDDEQFIYKNAFVVNFDVVRIFTTNTIAGAGEISNYYRPLTTFSFAWDYLFWGFNPFGYHLTNTLIHIGVGVLLYYLLRQLNISIKVSFWIALIFLLHPLQTEAVTYVNSRGDSMYSFFGLASLITLLLYFKKKSFHFSMYNVHIYIPSIMFFVFTPILYLLSILGKEIGVAILGLQATLLTYFFLMEKKKNIFLSLSKQRATLILFFINCAIAGFYIFLRATSLNFSNSFDFYGDESLYSESLFVRLLTFSKIIFVYLRLLFVPFPLYMERTTTLITSPLTAWSAVFCVLVLFIFYAGLSEIKKKNTGYILLGWSWFFIMLLPVSGVIPINGLLYEHWLYLPMVGFLVALYGTYRLFIGHTLTPTITKIVFILAVLYSVLTIRQNYLWGEPVRFFSYLLNHTDSARIHNNLAMSLSEIKRYEEAIVHYKLALEYGIPYPHIYHNLANTYVAIGLLNEAESSYLLALSVDPHFFHSYNKIIMLYNQQGRYVDAMEMVQKAKSQFPASPNYDLIELELLKAHRDKPDFDRKKSELLTKYQDEEQIKMELNRISY